MTKAKIRKVSGRWIRGKMVRVGSLTLVVDHKVETPVGEPDAFMLDSLDRTRHYQFQPFRGIRRVA